MHFARKAHGGQKRHLVTLTYLGHSAVRLDLPGARVYIDPYFKDPVDWTKLPKGDLVLFSHGHFDHGVLMAGKLYDAWRCQFVGPKALTQWMARKYRRKIPGDALIAANPKETFRFKGLKFYVTPAHHPINRLGKTLLALFARSSAPGKPVNGYHVDGYYH